jgi:hypothetical protein
VTAAERRHERVEKWTKNVNLFEKYEGTEKEIELFLEGVCNEINGNTSV